MTRFDDVPDEGFALVLERGGDPEDERIQISGQDIYEFPKLQPEISAVGRWELDVPESESLRDWLRSDAYIFHAGELVFRGDFTRFKNPDNSAQSSLIGLDIMDELDRGGARLTVEEPEFGFVILDEFLDSETPFDVDLIEPGDDLIDDDFTVQQVDTEDELLDIFDTEGEPFETTEDGELRLINSLTLREAEDGSGGSFFQDEEFSGNAGRGVFESESFSVFISTEYDIEDAEFGYRIKADEDDSHPSFEIRLDGDVIENAGDNIFDEEVQWRTISVGELPAGTHEVEFDAGSGTGFLAVDVVSLFDDRFDHPLTNEVNEDFEFDPPIPTKPDQATIEGSVATAEFNIVRGRVSVEIDETNSQQRLQLSFDGGETWVPTDGSETDTSEAEADAEDPTTSVKGRLSLGRTGATETPTVSSWRIGIDTNALRVIEEQEYAGSALDIATEIADDSGMILVPIYNEDKLQVRAMEPGAVEREVKWRAVNQEFVDTTEDYWNAITVFGGEDANGDDIEVSVESQSEIDRIGERVEGPAVDRPDATTEPEAAAIARVELARGIAGDQVTGSVEIESQIVQPGYAYTVEEFPDSPTLTLQSARFQWGTMSLDFERDDFLASLADFAADIKVAKRASR